MIENIHNGWEIKELGDCVDILDNQRIPLNNQERAERTKNKDISELYPYYGATKQAGFIDDYIFNEELILLGEDGVMFYDKDKPKAYLINGKSWVNNHAHVLRAKKDITVNKYLLNFLNTFNYKGFVRGATRLKLNQSRMRQIPIPIPPLKQQEKIVKVLDISSSLIEKQKKLIENYDLFLKSKFIEMFGCPIKNPMEWEVHQIKKGINKIKNDNPLKQPQKQYIYIDIGSLNNKYIENYNYIIGENAPSRAKQITYFNDILVSTVRPNLNNVAMVKSKYEDILSSTGFCILRTNKNIFNSYYLFEVVKHQSFIQSLIKVAKGASYPAINNNNILDLKISVPPIKLQNKFASIVEKIEIIKEKENNKLKSLENLHNSLMQKAFKGEIE